MVVAVLCIRYGGLVVTAFIGRLGLMSMPVAVYAKSCITIEPPPLPLHRGPSGDSRVGEGWVATYTPMITYSVLAGAGVWYFGQCSTTHRGLPPPRA